MIDCCLCIIVAQGRRLITVPVSTKNPGKANFQMSIVAGKYGDASELSIPVYPPATTESFAMYGQLEKVLKSSN